MSVRLRLALLYGALFLVSGAFLLALTYVLVAQATAGGSVTTITGTGTTPAGAHALTATSHAIDLHALVVQSAVALGVTSLLSFGLGWLMAGRVLRPLEDSYQAQRRFVANASHELRTPLAMMRTTLDVAIGKPDGVPEQTRKLEVNLREDLDRADRLLESFLSLAQAQYATLPDAGRVSLRRLVTDAIEARRDRIDERQLDVETALTPVEVEGSEALLARMVENLVENAVLHNRPHGHLRVSCGLDGSRARLLVESSGAVLDPASVGHLVEPFRRLGAERTASNNGFGLGLSIVDAVAAAHGGGVALHARPQGGLAVQITLPCAAPAARNPVPA